MKKDYALADVLTVATGRLVSRRGMDAVYDVINFMTGDDLYTHQLVRGLQVCKPAMLRQHPQLAAVNAEGVNADNLAGWLVEQEAVYGKTLPVEPLAEGEWERIHPLPELVKMREGLHV